MCMALNFVFVIFVESVLKLTSGNFNTKINHIIASDYI